MAKNLIDNSKEYLKYYYNSDGTWVEEPKHKWNAKDVSPEAIEFVSNFFHFLIESTFLCDYTKEWLKSNLGSMRAMVDAHNNQVDEIDRWVLRTVLSNIDYDKRKLKCYFTVDMVDEVFAYPELYIEDNTTKLDSLQRIYMKDSQYTKALAVRIPKQYINKTVDDKSWALLLQMLKTYSKQTLKSISDGTHSLYTQDILGYYNYLISNNRLNDVEQARLQEIKTLLGIV